MARSEPTFMDTWFSKPGYLYFIGAGEPLKAIKIGVTVATGFKARLRSHQSSNHEPLRVLGIIDFTSPEKGMREAEKPERSLHQKFAEHQRFQNHWVGYEWFNPHPEILEFIQKNAFPV